MQCPQSLKLRPYQEVAVKECVRFCNSNNNFGLLVAPTASGKSLMIAETIRQLGDPKTLILQPTVELLKQNYEKYTNQGGQATLYSHGADEKIVSNVTYATPGSIRNKYNLFDNTELIIIDEAHYHTSQNGIIDNLISYLGNVKVIGYTATPIKLSSRKVKGRFIQYSNILTKTWPLFWRSIFHVIQLEEMYSQGYLTPLRFTTSKIDLSQAKIESYDYDKKDVINLVKKYNTIDYIVWLIETSIERGKNKILVFIPSIDDLGSLENKLSVESASITSKTKKKVRKNKVEEFKNGELKVLLNYSTLTTGFDAPNIDLIICARPTTSFALWYQMLGRGMRLHPDKQVCDVIDLSGNYKRFGDPKYVKFEIVKDWGWAMLKSNRILTNVPIGYKVDKNHLSVLDEKLNFGKLKGTKMRSLGIGYFDFIKKHANNIDKELKIVMEKLGV